jgi:hypothetical protein
VAANAGSVARNQTISTPLALATPVAKPAAAAVPDLGARRLSRVEAAIFDFISWLEQYGETSYDFQTFYASRLGRSAKGLYYRRGKLGILAVAPIIFCEAFVPSTRRFFFIRQRFPIGDAHYAMGFARLHCATGDRRYLDRAVHFLEVLLSTAIRCHSGLGWGYPFDWETIDGTFPKQTPLITTLPYVYEAFAAVYEIDRQPRWLEVMRSIAEHAFRDYVDHGTRGGAATCAYSTMKGDQGYVVNASAYRAFLLTRAAVDLKDETYLQPAERNLQFVLDSQNADGSWYYAVDGRRSFIDHYHTCFVLKALAKIRALTNHQACGPAIDSGVAYYVDHLFDGQGIPRPFAKPPRLVVYRRELYDYAECLNLATVLRGRFQKLDERFVTALDDLLNRWQTPDGSFKSRQLLIGWDAVPMHRWAQAQAFRSLCGLLVGPGRSPKT